MDAQHTMKWAPRLMGLTSKDIGWYKHDLYRMESKEVIMRCGEFPNVPLMGIRGGINYNPTLSRRQLGYALMGPPKDELVKETLFYDVPDKTDGMKRAIQAWGSIHYEGGQYFGKKDPTAYAPYIRWIEE